MYTSDERAERERRRAEVHAKIRDVDRQIGALIERALVAAGITQAALAELLSVGAPQVSQWISGRSLRMSSLAAIAEVLGYELQVTFQPKADDAQA